jgi:outer membrane protein assembly factor BamA
VKSARTNYRLEDVWATVIMGLHARSGLRIAGVVGLIETNVGPGSDGDYASSETVFSEATAPGLGSAPDYWRVGAEVDYDRRNSRDDTTAGGFGAFSWNRFADRSEGDFSFNRYTAEYRQFVALGTGRRLAGRARFAVTREFEGHRVPIFLQPSVGGTDTVRGFHQYRFRSGSAVVFNLEYRHDFMGVLRGVAFVDAGRVGERPSDLDLGGLEGSLGGGIRVRFGDRVFFGADVGVSDEGSHLWFRSGHTF